ncbi:MAG TPA: anaerobic ribonucleoside-triphosphate reductase activating protein [Sediminispirochaeta sp.]|nr:anaerobic ribonucleoside-triphosphate reductase activating protein [Sediminispirochaeta sp.]
MSLRRVGLIKTSLVDFPGTVAATVFTPGCNLRCPYCHNPRLVAPPYPDDMISLEELDAFLSRRSNLLGGVCISGGEPLLHDELPALINLIKSHGLKVKLDTNGTMPERLQKVEADYVAMDLKTAPERYWQLLGPGQEAAGLSERIRRSLEILKARGIDYEIRSTVALGIIGPAELRAMLPLLQDVPLYRLSPFKPGETLDPNFGEEEKPDQTFMENLYAIAREAGVNCELH